MTEGAFFQDLALVMAVAGLVAALFSRMRWPKVLGYIGAGVLLNKYTWGGSLLADSQSINTIAQLGVVFLMFSMGARSVGVPRRRDVRFRDDASREGN